MDSAAYIAGYLQKQAEGEPAPAAATAPSRWPAPPAAGSIWNYFIPGQRLFALGRDAATYHPHINRPDAPAKFSGPHEGKFTNPLVKGMIKGTKYEFMGDEYKPQPMGKFERYAPPSLVKWQTDRIGKQIEEGVAKGDYTMLRKYYSTNPQVRAMAQQRGWDKFLGTAKGYAVPAIAGAAAVGIPWMLSSMFQGSPQQPQQDPRIAQLFQNLTQKNPQAYRLGLVDRSEGKQ